MKDQDMKNQEGKSQQNQDNTGKGYGVSGQNPANQEGPVAGSAENTRGENKSGQDSSDDNAGTLNDQKNKRNSGE